MNELIKITIPGNAIVKKNSKKTSLYRKDKRTGRIVPLSKPVTYYSKQYNEWSKDAVQACAIAKTKHPEIEFPITTRIILKCLFFFNKNVRVDLSNLYEGTQDIITGNCHSINLPKNIYQILEDDSVRFILGHDGSRFLLDYKNPRTEVFLIPFVLKSLRGLLVRDF